MVAFSKVALVAFVGSAFATPLTLPKVGPLKLFDELRSIPRAWKSHGPANKQDRIKAQIGLAQSNISKLQEKLLDISDPDSDNYGKWLSKEEIDSIVAPPAANVAAVKAWLAANGITDVSQPSPDWIEFTVPVSHMESLLDAKYETFSHEQQGRPVPRTMKYSVPKALHDMIDFVTPTTAMYANLEPTIGQSNETSAPTKRQSCNTNQLTPSCIQQLYNVDYTSKGNQYVATTGFIEIGANHNDYYNFGQSYVRGGLADFHDYSISSGSNPGQGDDDHLLEGNLDTQYAGALSSPNPNYFLAVGPNGQDFTDEVANFASWLTTVNNPPSAVSTSYGGEEQYFSNAYLTRVCNEFMKAGSRGVSVFFSSGDSGVGGNKEASCSSGYYKLWPASCPWSTAVGGTEFYNGQEYAAQFDLNGYAGSTGGGYSDVFPVPDYQRADTQAYAANLDSSYNGYQNSNYRGYPDISLVSKNYQVVTNGRTLSVLGTSASSPSWAALVSVLNDYRYTQGRANLGFINPLLYGKGRSALRDVTLGNNRGCGGYGYPATKGWDPTTGLGTLDFGKLRAMI